MDTEQIPILLYTLAIVLFLILAIVCWLDSNLISQTSPDVAGIKAPRRLPVAQTRPEDFRTLGLDNRLSNA